ncbi:MAG: molybdopterin molybdotransferase MoeA [Planctomycetaceae bacterium]|nr:molybdopterin molybdotransferase MoeA [Planctomycetaceae bacterium]
MITVDAALRLVLEQATPLAPARVPLGHALGCVLADDVASDLDSPPWDKSMVDGYAIRVADLATGTAELEILEEIVAGAVPTRSVVPGATTRIMTGAPLPPGSEAVVMVERAELLDERRVRLADKPPRPGQNILVRGSSFRRGERIIPRDTLLGPVHIGLLCEVGCAEPVVRPRPRVAILSTGNELVSAAETPRPGQIRNSNGPMLAALTSKVNATPIELGVARDELADLRRRIAAGLESDLLVLSGGVSAGVLDLVPSVLAELGVAQIFHKVNLKPGKPIWFGSREAAGHRTLVFGLPGNPVSSLVGFELFVRPAIERRAGRSTAPHSIVRALIDNGPFTQRGDRTTYYPATCDSAAHGGAARLSVRLLPWQGSADLRTLAAANALVVFPAGERTYATGDEVDALLL